VTKLLSAYLTVPPRTGQVAYIAVRAQERHCTATYGSVNVSIQIYIFFDNFIYIMAVDYVDV